MTADTVQAVQDHGQRNLNPFIYGRVVRPGEFFNRQPELSTVFGRLRQSESTNIVGEPHIGKSSMLLKIADPETQRRFLGDGAERLAVANIDLMALSTDYTPAKFWSEALDEIEFAFDDEPTIRRVALARDGDLSRRSLERLFAFLGRDNRRLVLLLDEFEKLLYHPNFQDPAFFALLRSLATRTGGLVVIPASRLSVAELNRRSREFSSTGSPPFNYIIDLKLMPFDQATVEEVLAQAGDRIGDQDREVIDQVAGRHPFLLQAMAAALFEEEPGPERYTRAVSRFYEGISFHFDDLWYTLDNRARAASVILSLLGLAGRTLGQDLASDRFGVADRLGTELRRLARLGLASMIERKEPSHWQYPVSWKGEQWTIGAMAFAWWVRDVVVTGIRVVPDFDEWLSQARYQELLSNEQWQLLLGAVHDGQPGEAENEPDQEMAIRLLEALVAHFNESDLLNLCHYLHVDYEDLAGDRKSDKARELVEYCHRRGRLDDLRERMIHLNPHLSDRLAP